MEEAVLEDASKMDDFYGIDTGETFHHFWDTYLVDHISSSQDILTKEEDWCNLSFFRNKSPVGVVIRDRLMTDAALGGPKPIKSEHSYSLLTSSPPRSPTTPGVDQNTPTIVSSSVNDAVISSSIHHQENRRKPSTLMRTRIEDIEECFPVISMNGTSCTLSKMELKEEIEIEDGPIVKGEPMSAPNSPNPPASPSSSLVNENTSTIITIQPHALHFSQEEVMQGSDSEDEDEEMYQNIDIQDFEMSCIETDGAINDGSEGLPPTPPSSAGSDSDTSASCSPERRDSQTSTHVQSLKGLLAPRLYVTNATHTHTTRRPINTPLISCQPKGSTGVLVLTEEEKRTLLAEGYPIPTKLPLSKAEEKSLKKIRRKIKNKISAQESRRKKKEYMDNLERRVTILTNENTSYKDRLSTLEDTNRELLKELQRLQLIIKERSS